MATAIWKTLKVFISSTFLDLELERDRLARVFSNLEQKLLSRCLTVRPYDLRWRDRDSDEPVVNWCLRMVEDCQYFVGILGNRYGWRAPFLEDGSANDQKISVTEMEVRKALKQTKRERRFFCFFVDENSQEKEEDREAVAQLKQELESQGETVFHCVDTEQLLKTIERHMAEIIDDEYPAGQKVAPEFYSYQQASSEFIELKTRGFVGRENYLKRLQNFAAGNDNANYLIISSTAGAGKSALLAQFVQHCREQDENCIAHFLNMGGGARRPQIIVENLLQQLGALGFSVTKSSDYSDAKKQLKEVLEQTDQPVIIVLDGVDEIDEVGRDLSWLPKTLPAIVRVVVSTRPVETLDILRSYPQARSWELAPLDNSEISQLIDIYRNRHKIEIEENDRELLIKQAGGNPLYLKVALDEMQASGVAVGQLALKVDGLFQQILDRLEKEYQAKFEQNNIPVPARKILNSYLGLIAAGRHGIQERELREILKLGDDFFLSVGYALRQFIITRNHFMDFFHSEFERTIQMQQGKSGMRLYHRSLAQYFLDKGNDYYRTLEELPFQLQWSENYGQLLKTLTDLDFLEAKVQAGMTSQLKEDFDFALNGMVVKLRNDSQFKIMPALTVDKNSIYFLHRIVELESQFLQRRPQSLFQVFWNYGYWNDSPLAQDHYQSLTEEERAMWQSQQSKLYRLVEYWRENKEKQDYTWLKSLRPMPTRLTDSLVQIFRSEGALTSLLFTPDGKKLIAGSYDGNIRIWELETGQIATTIVNEYPIFSMDISRDGKKLAVGSIENRIWGLENEELIISFKAHEQGTRAIRFFDNDNKLISGGHDKKVLVWDLKGNSLFELLGHEGIVHAIDCHDGNRRLVTACEDNKVRLWDSADGKLLMVFEHKIQVTSAKFSPDGSFILSAGYNGIVRQWSIITGAQLAIFPQGSAVMGLDINRQNLTFAAAATELGLWDIASQKLISQYSGHKNIISGVCFSPDGKQVATCSMDNSVRVWNSEAGSLTLKLKGHSQYQVSHIAFNQEGTLALSSSMDCTACIWDMATGKLLRDYKGNLAFSCAAFHPTEDKIALGTYNDVVQIYHKKEISLLKTLPCGQGPVSTLCYNTDGTLLATGSFDMKVRLFQEEKLVKTLEGHNSPVIKLYWQERQLISESHIEIITWDMNGKIIDKKDKIPDKKFDHPNRKYRTVIKELETVIEEKTTNKSVAYFGEPLENVNISKKGVIAGNSGSYVYFLKLVTYSNV